MNFRTAFSWTWTPPAVALLLAAAIAATGGNQAIFLLLNHAGHALPDAWWAYLTILGDGAVALALVLPGIRRAPRRFWATLVAGLIVGLGVQLSKQLLPLPRPLSVIPAELFFHSGPSLRAVSFPSGHAATIFALTGAWIIRVRGHLLARTLLFSLAVLVAASRLMVGVHWPLDVLAGVAGGWLAACAGLRLSEKYQWRTSGMPGLLAGGVLLLVAVSLLFSRHTGFASALVFQKMIGLTCLIAGAWEMHLLARTRVAGPRAGGERLQN